MPFRSERQRRFFFHKASQPGAEGRKWKRILRKYRKDTPKGIELPEKAKTASDAQERRLRRAAKKNADYRPGSDREIFHGSPSRIRQLEPRPHFLAHGEPVVFGTPEKGMALSHLARWTDDDFDLGRVNDGPLTMKELYPGAFEKIYGGKKGYIYRLDPDGFEYDPRLMRSERMSRRSPRILSVEEIDDVLKALEESELKMVRSKKKTAAVKGPIKQYRRALQALREGVPFHGTSHANAASIARSGQLNKGKVNFFGEGTYWSTDPSSYGMAQVAKTGDRSMIERINDPRAAGDWRIHRTQVGTPIGRKDTIINRGGKGRKADELRAAAREGKVRIIEPEPFRMADLVRSRIDEPDMKKLMDQVKRRKKIEAKVRKKRLAKTKTASLEKISAGSPKTLAQVAFEHAFFSEAEKIAKKDSKTDRVLQALPGIGAILGGVLGGINPDAFDPKALFPKYIKRVGLTSPQARAMSALLGAGTLASTGWLPSALRDTYRATAREK